MTEFKGTYFNGKTSQAYDVRVFFDGKFIRIRGDGGHPTLDVPLEDCVITPPLGKSRRWFRLPDGARCETDDLEAIQALEHSKGGNRAMRFIHFLESRWLIVASCLSALVLCVWAFTSYGIPFLAEHAANSIPSELTETVSRRTLEVLDGRFLSPSELGPERVSEIKELFRKLDNEIDSDFEYRLEFRKSPQIGANAFALPSGLILMTDELAELANNDKELVGIFVHERAHVEKRHGLRSMFQNAGVFLLISALVGDVASITSMAAALPTILVESGYSRKFESEADEAAGLYFIRKGWSTRPYQNILLRLSEGSVEHPMASVLSSHPETNERVKYLQALEESAAAKGEGQARNRGKAF